MSDTGASFNRPYKPFGMNVKVPEIGEKTLKLAGGTLENKVLLSALQCVWKMKK